MSDGLTDAPCPRCGDTTDHESDDALCGCLAKLEGWSEIASRGIGVTGTPPDGYTRDLGNLDYHRPGSPYALIPRYMTDPREMVSMMEAMPVSSFHVFPGAHPAEITVHTDCGDEHYRGKNLNEAVARARHAMKLAEWVAKQPAAAEEMEAIAIALEEAVRQRDEARTALKMTPEWVKSIGRDCDQVWEYECCGVCAGLKPGEEAYADLPIPLGHAADCLRQKALGIEVKP